MIELTLAKVKNAARDVVAELGEDYVYEKKPGMPTGAGGCAYVWEGQASCIVARILHRLDVPLHCFVEGKGVHAVLSSIKGSVVSYDDNGIVPRYLTMLQSWQDKGKTYGDALWAGTTFLDGWDAGRSFERNVNRINDN